MKMVTRGMAQSIKESRSLSPNHIRHFKEWEKDKKVVYEKQVVFYSEKYAKKAKADRAKVIAKAMDIIQKPGKYSRATT